MKLICEGSFGDSDEKRNESALYILGPDSMGSMVISFKEIEKVYTFATNSVKHQEMEQCIRIPISSDNAIKGRRLL